MQARRTLEGSLPLAALPEPPPSMSVSADDTACRTNSQLISCGNVETHRR